MSIDGSLTRLAERFIIPVSVGKLQRHYPNDNICQNEPNCSNGPTVSWLHKHGTRGYVVYSYKINSVVFAGLNFLLGTFVEGFILEN